MDLLSNNSSVNDSSVNNSSINNFSNSTNTINYENYIFIAIAGPIAVVIFIAICVYIYSKIIKICDKSTAEGKIIVESFQNPTFNEQVNSILLDKTICCICLDDVNNNQNYVTLNCGHVFHRKCLETWVKTRQFNSNCPLCRECIIKFNQHSQTL